MTFEAHMNVTPAQPQEEELEHKSNGWLIFIDTPLYEESTSVVLILWDSD